MSGDLFGLVPPPALIALTGALTYFSVHTGLSAVLSPASAGQNQRLKEMRANRTRKKESPGADKRASIQARLKELEKKQKKGKSLSGMLDKAGMSISVARYLLIFGVLAAAMMLGLISAGMPPAMSLIALPFCLVYLPRWYAKRQFIKKQKKFVEEMPNAIDVLVRGVRTGLPVNDGLKLIAREIPDPVGAEFAKLTDSLTLGMTLDEALRRFYERMPIPEVNFFAIVLIIQKTTGGNLAEALGNLSIVIRDRKKLTGKIKALSSEAKASAMIIGSLPFVLGLVLLAISPDYIKLLFTERTGQFMVLGGLTWMGLGWFVMSKMIDIDV